MEITGHLLRPAVWAKDEVIVYWQQYLALVDVAAENARLRDELRKAEQYLALVREDQAELARLRALVTLAPPEQWKPLGVRILAGRFGPGAALETVMINRGFATGAAPGTPLATHQGLAGKVFRASPHAATVLLLTDRSFRVGVISQKSRVPGVLAGQGPRSHLDVRYMAPNMPVEVGELLITSGLDGDFPKGIPVARVISAGPGNETLFQQVHATPLVPVEAMEEALLLIPPTEWISGKKSSPAGSESAQTTPKPGAGNATMPHSGPPPTQSRNSTSASRPAGR